MLADAKQTEFCTYLSFFFFNDTATTEIYTLSLHDALPILRNRISELPSRRERDSFTSITPRTTSHWRTRCRSEEHTSELQSQSNIVCRLLLEKKKEPPFWNVPLSYAVAQSRTPHHHLLRPS